MNVPFCYLFCFRSFDVHFILLKFFKILMDLFLEALEVFVSQQLVTPGALVVFLFGERPSILMHHGLPHSGGEVLLTQSVLQALPRLLA
jgi:hypothetical protein